MSYSDYSAKVYCNGERRTDKEDVSVFGTVEESYGVPIDGIPKSKRIWASLIQSSQDPVLSQKENPWVTQEIHHGILGDGPVRVMCHKQGLPRIYEMTEEGIIEVQFHEDSMDWEEYDTVRFEYKGYSFCFRSGSPFVADMTEPDGTKWHCEYDCDGLGIVRWLEGSPLFN